MIKGEADDYTICWLGDSTTHKRSKTHIYTVNEVLCGATRRSSKSLYHTGSEPSNVECKHCKAIYTKRMENGNEERVRELKVHAEDTAESLSSVCEQLDSLKEELQWYAAEISQSSH